MITRFACLSVAEAAPLIAIWATPTDLEHVAGRRPVAARDALAARAALRALLAEETGHSAWDLRADAAGKPFACTRAGEPGPAITLSHSVGMVAVAIGAQGAALGIDIEFHRPREYDRVAAYAFGSAERAAVQAEGAQAFYRIWTAREARAKAMGRGLAEVLTGGDQAGAGKDLGCWRQDGFYFRHQRPFQLYSMTIAADAPLPLTASAALG